VIFETIQKASLYHLLFLIDADLAEQQRGQNCPFCGSVLHYSNYFRKPRGGPEDLPEEFLIRHSLCCSKCRRRVLPVSCRFWGRRVYWGVVMLVVCSLRQRRTSGYGIAKLRQLLDISRQTLSRWAQYFAQVFPLSSAWQRMKGRIGAGVLRGALPGAVLHFFTSRFESAEKGLIASVQFLSGVFDPF